MATAKEDGQKTSLFFYISVIINLNCTDKIPYTCELIFNRTDPTVADAPAVSRSRQRQCTAIRREGLLC